MHSHTQMANDGVERDKTFFFALSLMEVVEWTEKQTNEDVGSNIGESTVHCSKSDIQTLQDDDNRLYTTQINVAILPWL